MGSSYSLKLKFKDKRISSRIHSAYLCVSKDDTMYFQIEVNSNAPDPIDHQFMASDNALGLFKENFEVTSTSIIFYFDESRIYKIKSAEEVNGVYVFTIYVSKLYLVFKAKTKDHNLYRKSNIK